MSDNNTRVNENRKSVIVTGLLVIIFLFSHSTVSSQQLIDCAKEIKEAQNLFNDKDFDGAITHLLPCLKNSDTSPKEKVTAYKLMAQAYFSKDDLGYAISNLQKAIELDPDIAFNSETSAPGFIDLFTEVKSNYESKQIELIAEKRINATKFQIVDLIPGVAQIRNGQKNKGIAILAAQTASLAAFFIFDAKHSSSLDDYDNKRNRYTDTLDNEDFKAWIAAFDDAESDANISNALRWIAFGVYAVHLFDSLVLPNSSHDLPKGSLLHGLRITPKFNTGLYSGTTSYGVNAQVVF